MTRPWRSWITSSAITTSARTSRPSLGSNMTGTNCSFERIDKYGTREIRTRQTNKKTDGQAEKCHESIS